VWRPPPAEVPRVQALLRAYPAPAPAPGAAPPAGSAAGGSSPRESTGRWDSESEGCLAADVTAAGPPEKAAAGTIDIAAAAGAGAPAAPAAPGGAEGAEGDAEADADAPPAGYSQAAALARAREGGWPLFHNNVYAFLYRSLYGRTVPASTKVPRRRVQRVMPHLSGAEADAARVVTHSFAPIRA
jgi:hypothetical protein